MKAKITWTPPPEEVAGVNKWPYGEIGQKHEYVFERNKPVEVTVPYIIKKASTHPHYKVEMIDPPPEHKKEPEHKPQAEDTTRRRTV